MRRISPTTFQIARRGTSREINRQIALNLVRSRQPISRADLARLMGVRRGAISRLVKDLLRAKQVFEGAKGESKRGRKPRHLYIETRRRCALAVDISASRTLMLVTDPLGHPLLEIQEFPTRRPAHGLVKHLAGNIESLLSEHPEFGECLGVGIVVAGLVDKERGRLRNAPTLGWRDVELQRAAARGGRAAGRGRERREGLRAGTGLGRARARPGRRTGRVRERLRRRRRRDRDRRPADARRLQQRRRVRPRLAQHGRPAVRLRPEGVLGSVRLGPRHDRALPRHRPLVARLGGDDRHHGRDDRGSRAAGRGAGARDLARDRLLPGPRLRDDREGRRAEAHLRERRDHRRRGTWCCPRCSRPCASRRSSARRAKPRS